MAASDDQINASAFLVLNKIQELRVLVEKLNDDAHMAGDCRKALGNKVEMIQSWISAAMD